MVTLSIRSKQICPNSPVTPAKDHIWTIDQEDKRFEICTWCQGIRFITNEEDGA